jgi:phage baseplate assembly protein V
MSFVARSAATDKCYYGVYSAIVTAVGDPKHPGEVRLRFDWFDPSMQTWCRVCNLYAGNKYGSFFHPEKDDEVLVAFMQGDMRVPIVLGGLYNGKDKPPTVRDANKDEKVLRTKAGHQITLDDTKGKEKIVIVDKSGNNSIEIDAVANTIKITATGKLTISAKGVEITSDAGIDIKSKAALTLKSDATVDATASGAMTLKGSAINLN